MNKTLEQYAKGNIDMNRPEIILSETELEFSVEAGNKYLGSFCITNDKKKSMKGVLYSESRLLHVTTDQFIGTDNLIQFEFDAKHLQPGDQVEEKIQIVSDCGEATVLVVAKVKTQMIHKNGRDIKTIDEWIQLAKADWSTAREIFIDELFETTLLVGEYKEYRTIYRGLLESKSLNLAQEEFMIAIHKKQAIQYELSTTQLSYEQVSESFVEHIMISKDTWGYVQFELHSVGDFIELRTEHVVEEDFIGDHVAIEFMIHPDKCNQGKNYGEILIESAGKKYSVDVVVQQKNEMTKHELDRRREKECKAFLTKNYIEFRRGNVPLEQYVSQARESIQNLSTISEQEIYQLYNIHFYLVSGEEAAAKELIEGYQGKLRTIKEENSLLYGGISYLNAMLYKDEASILFACDAIKEAYQREPQNYWLFWFLLLLDKQYYNQPKQMLEHLYQVFEDGVTSPVLYFEAMSVYVRNPSLLYSLGKIEIQVLNFGLKHQMITEDVANQIAYLATKERYYNRIVCNILKQCYEKQPTKDILTAICSMLIKGHIRTPDSFKWYSLGVEEQIRVTELHEYYMYTIDESKEEPLPQPILLYYIYNSSLTDKKRAYLYARIVKDKEKNGSIYRTYAKKIEQFAKRQLAKQHINENLAVLYECLIEEGTLEDENIADLAIVAHRVQVQCDEPMMRGVTVVQTIIDQEEMIPFADGKCQITMLSEDTNIYICDNKGNRFCASVPYKLHRYLPWSLKLQQVLGRTEAGMYGQVSLLIKPNAYRHYEQDTVELCNHLLELPEIKNEIKIKLLEQLISYFDAKHAKNQMELYLKAMPLGGLTPKQRVELIELCIRQDCYELACELIREYGYESISIGKLTKLCTHCISLEQNKDKDAEVESPIEVVLEPSTLLAICIKLLQQGCTEEKILMYLSSNYSGPTSVLFDLYQKLRSLNMNVHGLEEQILAQVLFIGGAIDEYADLFENLTRYYGIKTVTRACLNRVAAEYIMNHHAIGDVFFLAMKQEVQMNHNPLCEIALVKKYSESIQQISEDEIGIVMTLVNRCIENGYLIPELLLLGQVIELPKEIKNRKTICYHSKKNGVVKVHYRFLSPVKGAEEFQCEVLTSMVLGIYRKSFLLFYHEVVEYYFTEESGDEVITTQIDRLKMEQPEVVHEPRFDELNQMLYLEQQNQSEKLANRMIEYMKNDFIKNHYFKSI